MKVRKLHKKFAKRLADEFKDIHSFFDSLCPNTVWVAHFVDREIWFRESEQVGKGNETK